jgi:putative aldouronate transport system substrate-binding protein
MMKRIVALLLAGLLIASFAACGSESNSSNSAPSEGSDSGSSISETAQEETGEKQKLVMAFATWVGALPDTQAVQDQMNEVLAEKGLEVELQISDSGSYKQNMTLALSSGEPIDVFNTWNCEYPNLVQQGYLVDMEENDNLNTNGEGIVEAIGQEYVDACRISGKLYGLPNNRDFAMGRGCVAIGTEYLEGIGYEVDEEQEIIPTTIEEINEIYAQLHETYPDLEVYRPVTGSMLQFSNIDNLGGSVFGVLENYGAELKVVNLFETDYYKTYCERMYDYNQKGYISADAATDTTSVGELTKAGTLMSYTTGGKPGIKVQETNLCGRPMTIFQTMDDYVSSASVASWTWSIGITTSDAGKSMQLIKEFYTNEDLANLLSWGIEDQHYKVEEDGLITYADGVDASTSGWNHTMQWLMPNQYITHVWTGNAPDLWEQTDTFNKEAKQSSAIGFSFDTTNVATEITSVSNVYQEFQKSLEFGYVDPATGLEEINEKIKAAGLDKIIEEKQKQLDAWAQTK